MAYSEDYLTFVLEQLGDIPELTHKKMFGGVGIYHEGLMFALIGNEKLCLKADDSNRADFETHGMRAFLSDEKSKGLPYWEVPVEILEDREALTEWAQKAYKVARQAKKKPKKRK